MQIFGIKAPREVVNRYKRPDDSSDPIDVGGYTHRMVNIRVRLSIMITKSVARSMVR